MVKKIFGLIAAFIGLTANAVSALNAPFPRSESNEVERLMDDITLTEPVTFTVNMKAQ